MQTTARGAMSSPDGLFRFISQVIIDDGFSMEEPVPKEIKVGTVSFRQWHGTVL